MNHITDLEPFMHVMGPKTEPTSQEMATVNRGRMVYDAV
jgi:hypothetical protein